MNDDYLRRILTAKVYDVAIESPLEKASRLSNRLGCEVWLKREDLQPVFSFKLRGAYNKLASLPKTELEQGVICASAGNHAQGVALAAQRLGARATVVMPVTTPSIKVEAVRELGGEVELWGENYDEAYRFALAQATQRDLVFIHPFDDPDVIAGQGTIGDEVLRQFRGVPDAVYVPIGGGGLIAGIASYIKVLAPEVRIVGVEPEDAASMKAALDAGRPVTLPRVGIFADGVAVRRVGDETFRICRELIDDIVLVNTDEICAAIQDIFVDTRSIVEPAGALAVAGLEKDIERRRAQGESLVAINGGANMNFDRLRHVAERADLGADLEALLAVEIPERPGSFKSFCRSIGRRRVTEFNYRFQDNETARIFVGLELLGGKKEKRQLISELVAEGHPVLDLSDNEVAKLHLRHLVGGKAPVEVDHELLFRFEFPERPGALADFLEAVGGRWNISLFHYRNHGSDFGRVLTGVQVPPRERELFQSHLSELGYEYWDESDNPAYRLFLGG